MFMWYPFTAQLCGGVGQSQPEGHDGRHAGVSSSAQTKLDKNNIVASPVRVKVGIEVPQPCVPYSVNEAIAALTL